MADDRLLEELKVIARSMITASHSNNLPEASFESYLREMIAKTASTKDKEYQNGTCIKCGGALSQNPHPSAGDPDLFLEVGTIYVCIPCEVKANQERIKEIAQLRADKDKVIAAFIRDYHCPECDTPGFIHLIIPVKVANKFKEKE